MGTEVTREEVARRVAAYPKWCADNNYPQFGPTDGRCYSCKKQIFEIEEEGPITGCPWCGRTYCD